LETGLKLVGAFFAGFTAGFEAGFTAGFITGVLVLKLRVDGLVVEDFVFKELEVFPREGFEVESPVEDLVMTLAFGALVGRVEVVVFVTV
jgi:hypothetical protein